MRVLWLCNLMLPKIAEFLNKEKTVYGGWLIGLLDELLTAEELNISLCFPLDKQKAVRRGHRENLYYYGFPRSILNYYMYDKQVETYLRAIVKDYKPDVIHIFGTEYPHTLAMVRVCNSLGLLDKVVISIQGLISICEKHYYNGLPFHIIHGTTIKEFIIRNNIYQNRKRFIRNGNYEIEAIKKVKHIIGRTDFDKSVIEHINPNANYYLCNESLREAFYHHTWDITTCKRHSILMSQGGYPLKGLHRVLEAMTMIIKRYPDTHLYIAGKNIIKGNNVTYGNYINRLIQKYHLTRYITFTGALEEDKMCNQYLQSHVYVLASSIENSPNSLGEAMILGVPTISSFVGGVSSLLRHNEEGFLYQQDATYMLAYYICKIFSDDNLARMLSNQSKKRAIQLYNRKKNMEDMYHIYSKIMSESIQK